MIKPTINGFVNYKLKSAQKTIEAGEVEVESLSSPVTKKRGKVVQIQELLNSFNKATLKNLGKFNLQLYWYNRAEVKSFGKFTDSFKRI